MVKNTKKHLITPGKLLEAVGKIGTIAYGKSLKLVNTLNKGKMNINEYRVS